MSPERFVNVTTMSDVFLTSEIAETYAPVRISVAYGGQNPVPKPFVMVLVWIHTRHGWKMTTDIPIPVPPDLHRADLFGKCRRKQAAEEIYSQPRRKVSALCRSASRAS